MNTTTHNDLMTETGLSDYQYTISLMLFLIAYGAFEAPSNMLLKQLRPSRWIAFLMVAWGALTISLGASTNPATLMALRFLLGVFEAGLFPGLVYYLTFWYRADERSMRVAWILASATLAGAFGGAIANGVGRLNQVVRGVSGWRWLFYLEGIPSVVAGAAVCFVLPDYPETARWLSADEKAVAGQRLRVEGSKGHHKSLTWRDAAATLMDGRLYAHYLVYLAISCPFSSLSLFSPSIVAGLGYHDLKAQLMTVPPYAVAYGMVSPPLPRQHTHMKIIKY